LSGEPGQDALLAEMKDLLSDFEAFCNGIKILGELTPRALDVAGSIGERMNARQVAAILQKHGVPANSVEATRLIITDDCFGAAKPKITETAEHTRAVLNPMLAEGVVPVVTGFIGATDKGILTTLGRGGSDYSATILGRALDADEVWIWTDVNGVMTTDPRLVPDARTIPQLSYAEVGEMAYFGAKVLHPHTIRPARQTGIPVRILNTFEPDHPGTLVSEKANGFGRTVKAITAIKSLSLVVIEGGGMLGVPGVAARTFGAVARTGTSVLMISQSSSEQSICFVVPTREVAAVVNGLKAEFTRELERRDIESIETQDDIVILAVVGAGMKGTPGIASQVFGALGQHGINVIAIAQGSSEYNISMVIALDDAEDAVRCLHAEFRLGEDIGSLASPSA
jgi:aspartate kinase